MTPLQTPLHTLTASETISLVRSGSLTCEELVEAHLARIEERDAQVQAWAWLDPAAVRAEARRMDQLPKERRGPLHGVLVGVKDIINTLDMPTQHNSPLYKGSFPTVDAAVISVLRSSGALIFGKTTTTEFAGYRNISSTTNPRDSSRTPGGSSSGSAAAVADYQVQVAVGTQTAGSVIRPASYCGTFSFKPTWGSVCHEGVKPFSPINDVVGFFSRSIEDLQLVAEVLGLTNERPAPSLSPRPLRIAICRTPQWGLAQRATIEAMATIEELLKAAGVEVTSLDLPSPFDDLLDYHTRIMAGDGRTTFQAIHLLDSFHPESTGTLVHSDYTNYALNASNTSRTALVEALDKSAALRPMIDEIVGEFDAVLAPSVPDVAPPLATTGDPRFCSGWTLLHVPVVNVPSRRKEGELPVGVSLVGRRFDDARLLEVAKEVAGILEGAKE